MNDAPSLESLFRRYRERGDGTALATVFDRAAPELAKVAGYLSGGDRNRAEDLLQQTWLVAITHASRWDGERPLLPWLLGVLANHARSSTRAQRRAVPGADVLETLLATDDPVRSSSDGEFAQLVQRALVELPSPFREAVTLHVEHGLTAVEIGRALDRPAGTVRTQIVRGLDRLRALLPVGLASLGVAAVLTAEQLLAVRRTVLAAAGGTGKSFLGERLVRWSAGLLLTAALATLALLMRAESVAPPAPAGSQAVPEVVLATPLDEPPAKRDQVSLPPRPLEAPVVQAGPRRITVHVRHADEPTVQAGTWVGLVAHDDLRFARTDARGDAVFDDVPEELSHRVFVSGTSVYEDWVVLRDPGSFRHEMTLTVPSKGALVVTVVDGSGRPVAGAEVEGNGSQHGHRLWCPLGSTDTEGVLRLRGQAQRGAQLRARAKGHAPARWQQVQVRADGSQTCRLTMEPAGQPLHGRVVDENGAPVRAELGTIAFASDLLEPWYDTTAADGTFTFEWLPNGPILVVARVRNGARVRCGLVRASVPSNGPVTIRVDGGGSLHGVTRGAGGGPAGGSAVSARLLADGAFALPFAQHSLRSVGQGTFRLDGLLPGRWALRATIGEAEVSEVVTVRAGEQTLWEATAASLQPLRAVLLDERRQPLVGWQVSRVSAQGHPIGTGWRSDANGREPGFAPLLVPTDAPVDLWLFDPAAAALSLYFPTWRVPGLVADGSVHEIVVPDRARATHTIRGLVVDEHGQPLRASGMVVSQAVWWDGPRFQCDADGRFTIGPFAPGRIDLQLHAPGRPVHRLARLEVPGDGDLDLGTTTMPRAGRIRVAAADGVRVPGDLRLVACAIVGGERHDLERRPDGTFGADGLPAGDYRLEGSSSSLRVRSCPLVAVAEAAADAAAVAPTRFQLEAGVPLRIAVRLGEELRAQEGWSATLVVRRRGEVVVQRSLATRFHGVVPDTLEFTVAAEAGELLVELDDHWRPQRQTVQVAATGGRVEFDWSVPR
ncbi:MAG: sigma-70 family RNA polymerase sigma factor [Planctomycetes bacterium]|nr:sigma-70 family RNA polymerase sigma factor [Planctomycetota bacterium]